MGPHRLHISFLANVKVRFAKRIDGDCSPDGGHAWVLDRKWIYEHKEVPYAFGLVTIICRSTPERAEASSSY